MTLEEPQKWEEEEFNTRLIHCGNNKELLNCVKAIDNKGKKSKPVNKDNYISDMFL
ncbi:unnamed protein product [Nyctereutes procyonoides]|uniref:(raccoon dog) hypothetical protein n=1 Tax=Nyctereutes procyonoides TaxID=34880 RepID=A0A811Y5E9_NYCPR|nr:unnamed protein product [Nyctereutes procyonoides]